MAPFDLEFGDRGKRVPWVANMLPEELGKNSKKLKDN